jgi:acyl-CoA reductase-like NAD-dependent aldehyde dehydrogenase
VIDGFYLPRALGSDVETSVHRFGPAHDAVSIRLPLFLPADVTRWIDRLRRARAEHLAHRPVAEILRPLERVIARHLDPKDRKRRALVQALLESGRYAEPMVQRALDDAFEPLARGGLRRWIASELGSVSALDRPVPTREGVLRRAVGPEWMFQIYAGNVPAVPVWPMLTALVLKSALLAKTSAQEPVLAPHLARAIAEEDEGLGRCMAVVWWKGGTAELERAALAEAPAVLAFGGETAITSLARQTRPDAKSVFHGPKVSLAYVGRGALSRANLAHAARRLALDVSLYDQQGCLSPHAVYAERGGAVTPLDLAAAIGEALQESAEALPRREPSATESAALQLYRAQARFDASASPDTSVLASSSGTRWTVVCEGGARFEPGPAHRTVRVHSITGPEEFERAVAGSARYIEALGLEETNPRRAGLVARFAALGIPRIAGLGLLQRPSPLGTHGGVRRLEPFVTWVTVEEARAPRAAKTRAPRAAKPPARRPTRAAKPKKTSKSSASKPSGRGSRTPARARRRSR